MTANVGYNSEKERLLQSYFSRNGVLSCNDNKDLPSLNGVGGDWNSIVSLIERGDVFYSKLYKRRVTYLSREFYYQIKPYKQRTHKLSQKSKEILEFIETVDLVTTKEIKTVLMPPAKIFSSCMDELFSELFVTAIQRDRTMNQNWSSFCWGTFAQWEQLHPLPETKRDMTHVNTLLSGVMSDEQIQSLLK